MHTGKGTILIIEDDHMIRDSLREYLALEGYAVLVAQHGQQALDLLQSADEAPDLLMLDLFMPVMDGVTFLDRFKRQFPSLSRTPVLLMSAVGKESPSLPRNFAPERIHFKPLNMERLISSIENILN